MTDISQFYENYVWPDEPDTEAGRAYFLRVSQTIRTLIADATFMTAVQHQGQVSILELCGGAGYGGIALAKALREQGIHVRLLVTDIREGVLSHVHPLAASQGVADVRTTVLDVKNWPPLEERFDVCLMYGLSMPHVNPWEYVTLSHAISQHLTEAGQLVIHDADRRLLEFLDRDYQKIALASADRSLISMHSGYDVPTGTMERTYYPVGKAGTPTSVKSFFWSVAELGALTWTFFQEVKLIPLENYRYFIVGKTPRFQ